ncbi:MAG: formylglycine-generating enzyme family protein, partial [Fibrobacterota bacterium]
AQADSMARHDERCQEDTVLPWTYLKPAPGMYYDTLSVQLKSIKPARIEWRFEGEGDFQEYHGEDISITRTGSIEFRAEDDCGNVFPAVTKTYEIYEKPDRCPEGMTFIEYGDDGFCIDHYEWPNKEGVYPVSSISLSRARDSCFSVGKRLPTSSEWEAACEGPYEWKYPYGDSYEPYACNVSRDQYSRSGMFSGCRGWYKVYDMAGNLAEWTDTPSDESPGFYIVRGGFWESGSRAGCRVKRHSYYPQNPHNPVGFRCVADPVEEGDNE